MNQVLGLYNYWIVIFLMMTGFYIVIARTNLIQKVIGLNIFQISVFLLYITMGKVTGGTAPILQEHDSHHATHSSAVPAEVAHATESHTQSLALPNDAESYAKNPLPKAAEPHAQNLACLLYTSPSPRDLSTSRMPSSA